MIQRRAPDRKATSAVALPPGIQPRWRRYRRIMFGISGLLAVGFVAAVLLSWNGSALACLILCWGLMSVALPLPHLPTLLRLMLRPFATLGARAEALLVWLEFDVERDAAR